MPLDALFADVSGPLCRVRPAVSLPPLDAESRIVEFNRAAEGLTGYASEEVCGREVWETGLIAQEEEPGFRETVAGLNAGEFPSRYEGHWMTEDGRRRFSSWRSSVVLGDDGEGTRVACRVRRT